jgi:hypothetical protein
MGHFFTSEINGDSFHLPGYIPTNILPLLNGMCFRRPSVNPRKNGLSRYPRI